MPEQFPSSSPSIQPFSFTCQPDGWGSAWLEVSGELDLAACPELRRALTEGLALAPALAVDLRELNFIDCAGLAELFDAAAEARRRGGRLSLIGGSGQVKRLLDMTGVPADVTRSVGPQMARLRRRRGARQTEDQPEVAMRTERS